MCSLSSLSLISQSSSSPRVAMSEELIRTVRVEFSQLCSPEVLVNNLASIEGPVDIYCWYEGIQGLPKRGAKFMKEAIFQPLYKILPNAKLNLYSLIGWAFDTDVDKMPLSTRLGEVINSTNKAAIEYLSAASFFQYCSNEPIGSPIYSFVNERLPKKDWLFRISKDYPLKGKTVDEIFKNRSSLLACIGKMDVARAYSAIQYIEVYFLIKRIVESRLKDNPKRIEIAFVLPNDEGKYYDDLNKEVEEMLRQEFGEKISRVAIRISFHFFEYGESISSRPYIDKKSPKVKASEIGALFDYISQPRSILEAPIKSSFPILGKPRELFVRDLIHGFRTY